MQKKYQMLINNTQNLESSLKMLTDQFNNVIFLTFFI